LFQAGILFCVALASAVVTLVLSEPFSHHHHHGSSGSASASESGSGSGSSSSASGSGGYHYKKPKKAFYLPPFSSAGSHTKIKIIKHHGAKKVKFHGSSYGTPSSSASGSGSGSGSSSSGSSSGSSGSGHAHHYKPAVKVIIKKHSKGHKIHHGWFVTKIANILLSLFKKIIYISWFL